VASLEDTITALRSIAAQAHEAYLRERQTQIVPNHKYDLRLLQSGAEDMIEILLKLPEYKWTEQEEGYIAGYNLKNGIYQCNSCDKLFDAPDTPRQQRKMTNHLESCLRFRQQVTRATTRHKSSVSDRPHRTPALTRPVELLSKLRASQIKPGDTLGITFDPPVTEEVARNGIRDALKKLGFTNTLHWAKVGDEHIVQLLIFRTWSHRYNERVGRVAFKHIYRGTSNDEDGGGSEQLPGWDERPPTVDQEVPTAESSD